LLIALRSCFAEGRQRSSRPETKIKGRCDTRFRNKTASDSIFLNNSCCDRLNPTDSVPNVWDKFRLVKTPTGKDIGTILTLLSLPCHNALNCATMNFINIRSYDNYIYANMQLGMLQELGINCHLKDEHTITVDPLLSPAIGGMKLMVAEPQVERALQLLEEAEKAYLQTIACPACGTYGLQKVVEHRIFPGFWSKIKSLLLNGQESEVLTYYKCSHCHKKFSGIPEQEPRNG
jgi:DNA-directed RNA polymerase subunit RPC12/RpoP